MGDQSGSREDTGGMDFDALGEILVGYNVLDGDSDVEESVQIVDPVKESIPLTTQEVVKPKVVIPDPKIKEIIEMLRKTCRAMGIICTIPMENQLKTISEGEKILEDHIIWYARGIAQANNSQILPSIYDSISELKTESRHLMNITNKASKTAVQMESSAVTLRNSLNDAVANIKESFEKTLVAVSEAYQDKVRALSIENEVKPNVVKVEIPKITTTEVKLNATADVKAVESEAERTSESVTVETVADIENVMRDKRAFLLSIGIGQKMIKEMNHDIIRSMLPDDLHVKAKAMKMTPKVKAALKEITLSNLKDYIKQMTPSTSGQAS